MPKISEIYHFLERALPSSLSCDWDNDGIMCMPDPDREVTKVLLALDITEEVVDRTVREEYDVIVSHHPLLFRGIKHLTVKDPVSRRSIKLCRAGITALSFHTRLDAVTGGVNDALAELLTLTDTAPFGDEGMGRVGTLSEPMCAEAFAATVAERLNTPAVTLADSGRPVSRVAVLGGSGGDEVMAALAAGADTYVTGEAPHHWLVDAPEMGLNLIVAGHHHTEQPVCARLADMIRTLMPEAEITIVNSYKTKTIVKA